MTDLEETMAAIYSKLALDIAAQEAAAAKQQAIDDANREIVQARQQQIILKHEQYIARLNSIVQELVANSRKT